MLETEDVDDDFFTPVAGTSLANIFGNLSKNAEATTNDTLKYIPPKPQNTTAQAKQEQPKTTECVFACALIGHEWSNNVYTSRGKLGFAIVKIQKTGDHNIVLYDSNKTTLSCATISSKLEVTIKNKSYLSYYDDFKKYWSIYGTEEEIKKVTDNLNSLGVNVNYSTYIDQGPLEPANVNKRTYGVVEQSVNKEIGSDTDSSINRKTKLSILNRMANMGHSVLPTRAPPAERTSDSSDTMEVETHPKSIRHKTVKSVVKRNNMDNNSTIEPQHPSESHSKIVASKTETVDSFPIYTSPNGQLLPLASTNYVTSNSNDLGLFMSEQRISNSELRINVNRITDKIDLVLDRINNIEHSVNTNVLMKLLNEYENKIKVYEGLLKSNVDKSHNDITSMLMNNSNDYEMLKKKISELENFNRERSNEVANLHKEISVIKSKHAEEKLIQTNTESELKKQVNSLEIMLKTKDEELTNMTKKCETLSAADKNINNDNIADKVKNIMNDTFQTISVNFDNNEHYSGESVKKIIATVIKKITIQTLNELNLS